MPKLGIMSIIQKLYYLYFTPLKYFFIGRETIFKSTEISFFESCRELEYCIELDLFDWKKIAFSEPPLWNHDYINEISFGENNKDFYKIPDFIYPGHDIKAIWELSKFKWIGSILNNYNDKEARYILNDWIQNWVKNNPPFKGFQWKCSQEAAFRVIYLSFILRHFNNVYVNDCFYELIHAHLIKIFKGIQYSKSQMNNHIISESVALFIGGILLTKNGNKEGAKFSRKGKDIFQKYIKLLVLKDGTFSQYSSQYHLLVLELVLIMLINLQEQDEVLDLKSIDKISKLCSWMKTLSNNKTGRHINLGHNDGMSIFSFLRSCKDDFRPVISLLDKILIGDTSNLIMYEELESFIKIEEIKPLLDSDQSVYTKDNVQVLNEGGFAKLNINNFDATLRLPIFHFRPSQLDILHLDLSIDGQKILRDSGTYSYNPFSSSIQDALWTNKGHNTALFDDHFQLRRFSRFLYLDWSSVAMHYDIKKDSIACSFTDYRGCNHSRSVYLSNNNEVFVLEDAISGFKYRAKILFHLDSDDWILDGNSIFTKGFKIKFTSSSRFSINLTSSNVSEKYFFQRPTQMVECIFQNNGSLRTEISKS